MQEVKMLVVIASYGCKNLLFLERVIAAYRGMSVGVDLVVVSDAPKDLGKDIQVVVGLPADNPLSLPFAHKRVFAENVDRYELFCYSEDDIEVAETQIKAFLRVNKELDGREIAGFLRYEMDGSRTVTLPDLHGAFRWKLDSLSWRGAYCIAEYTNEHAGFYLLTQAQLRQAIASGGFLRAPYEGRYGMLESAATDPYTSCGFRKVICISEYESFLLPHLSNRYAGKVGPSLDCFKGQIQTLLAISRGKHPPVTLCEVESKLPGRRWSKRYDEPASDRLLRLVPSGCLSILSIGCGYGDQEAELVRRGHKVTALPLDSVIGEVAARRGIEVVYGKIDEGPSKLAGRQFDCVLMTNLLHLFPRPEVLLNDYAALLRVGGWFVLAGPNFEYLPTLMRRVLRRTGYSELGSFEESGVRAFGMSRLKRWLRGAGLEVEAVVWHNANDHFTDPRPGSVERVRLLAKEWIMRARRSVA